MSAVVAIFAVIVCALAIRMLIAAVVVYITCKRIDAVQLRQEMEWEHARRQAKVRVPVGSLRFAGWRRKRAR